MPPRKIGALLMRSLKHSARSSELRRASIFQRVRIVISLLKLPNNTSEITGIKLRPSRQMSYQLSIRHFKAY